MPSKYTPRLSVEITDEQYDKLKRLIPWGVKNTLFSIIIDEVIELIEEHGTVVIAGLLNKKLTVQNLHSIKEFIK